MAYENGKLNDKILTLYEINKIFKDKNIEVLDFKVFYVV